MAAAGTCRSRWRAPRSGCARSAASPMASPQPSRTPPRTWKRAIPASAAWSRCGMRRTCRRRRRAISDPRCRPAAIAWPGTDRASPRVTESPRPPDAPASLPRTPTVNLVFPHTFVPWFRTVAPHIHAYHGKTFVVAIAGELIAAGKLNSFAQDLAILQAMGIKLVLVHGFRPQVNEQLRSKGHEARYHNGLRITDAVALDSAQEAAGQLRFEIEAAFSQGLPNTPMANAIVRVVSGNFLTARPVGIVDGVDFIHSGVVRKVDGAAIRSAIDIGAMVLLSPFGFSPTGEAFNLTMEDVATSTAIALQADKLLFITEVPGIHEDLSDPESPIDTELALADAERLLAQLPRPTRPIDPAFYLQHCVRACRGGVERSHILPFAMDGALLMEVFTHDGIGTMVVDEKLESLREATSDDIGGVLQLIEPFEQDGTL